MHAWRVAFATIAWLFVAAVVIQVFLAGIGLFGAGDMLLHVEFGWGVAYLPILVLLLAWPARPGRGTVWLCVALFVAGAVIQPSLPGLRDQLPAVAALHPPNALLVFWLALLIARRATALVRGPSHVAPTPEPAAKEA